MDIDIHSILRSFVKRFVVEEHQVQVTQDLNDPRSRGQLIKSFLSERGILERKTIQLIDSKTTISDIITELGLDIDLVYVISENSEIDDKVMEVEFALKEIQNRKSGGIIVNLHAYRIYIEAATIPPLKSIGKFERTVK